MKLLPIILLSIIPAVAYAQKEEPVSCRDFCLAFAGQKATQLQKEELFAMFKDKPVTWRGQVVDISDGIISGPTLQMKCLPKTLVSDVIVRFSKEQKAELMKLSNGQTVTISGKLKSWGSVMPHEVVEGRIVSVPALKKAKTK